MGQRGPWHNLEEILIILVNKIFICPTVCLVGWFLNVLVNYKVISRTGPETERLTILRAATHETELGDHDFCLSRSHYTDTDPTSRERAICPKDNHFLSKTKGSITTYKLTSLLCWRTEPEID